MLKVSDAPVSFCFLPCIFRLAFLHPLEKNTFNTDIGDLKSKRCRLVYKTQAKLRQLRLPGILKRRLA